MDRPWLTQYPPGMPADVDVQTYPSLRELFVRACGRHAGLPAYSNMGTTLTYRELDRASRDFGAWLQQGLGLVKGDRVALMMPNLLQYPVALFGAFRAGLTVVNVNPLYTPRELAHQLRDSGASAIVVLENMAATVQAVLEGHPDLRPAVVVTQVGDMLPQPKRLLVNTVVKYVKRMVPAWYIPGARVFTEALHDGHEMTLRHVPLNRDDIAFLQYTGGTTGVAKGVVLTHANLVANVEQVAAWIARDLVDGKETCILPLPLYHVYALTSNLVFVRIGGHIVLITNPRDLPAFVGELKRTRFSAIIGVNTLYRALLQAPAFAQVDLNGLKLSSAGGMAVQRVVAQEWKARAGIPLVEGYGLTETSPVAISNPLSIEDWTGTIGLPLPSTLAAVLDDDGRVLPPGELGEICIRGPQVMREYWRRPDETARVFTSDGWLRTGDMGTMDERGWFRITDRKKDMVIVSGFKVFPNEVEDVVAMHPGVQEVAAIGVPDPASGEVVKVIVVRKDPALTQEAVLAHCRANLTAYKIPRVVEFRDEPLPKTNIGKVLRRQLREGASVVHAG